MTSPASPTAPAPDARSSVGEMFSDVAQDLSTLMRQEVELAKAEVRQSAVRAAKGAGMLAGAGVAGHMVLIFVSVAAWWGIGDTTGHGWSALIVGAAWLVIAAVLGLLGRREIAAVSGLPQTAQTVKKIPDAVKGNEGTSMTSDPDQIREQIEETRSNLSQDVNTLADTVNPAHAARRTAASARSAVTDAKDKVMGTASQSASGMSSATGEKLSAAQEQLRSQASGNPLAVGLIALGARLARGLAAAATSAEQQAAVKVKDAAMPAVTGAAKEAAASLQELCAAGSRSGQGHGHRCRRHGQGPGRQLGARRPGSGTGSPRHGNRQPPVTAMAAMPGLMPGSAPLNAPQVLSGVQRRPGSSAAF